LMRCTCKKVAIGIMERISRPSLDRTSRLILAPQMI
jgi:hypothetical protein